METLESANHNKNPIYSGPCVSLIYPRLVIKKIMVQDLALVQFSSICLICQNPTKYWGSKNQRQGTISLFGKIYAIHIFPEKNIPS